MAFVLLLLTTLLSPVIQIPKNDPNGIWEADGGTRFDSLHLTGQNLTVHLVSGSNPLLASYDLELRNQGEVNTYAGKGTFVAKVKENKECKFEVDWRLIVVNTDHIVAEIPQLIPDPDTCEVKQRVNNNVELVKK